MSIESKSVRPKVFGIGFHKTATTSLAEALDILGYRVTGPNGIDNPQIAREVRPLAWDLIERYDAFQDNPWPILFRELDERCPGSKFILTWRSTDAWIRSMVRHFGGQSTPMREWIYGPGQGDPQGREELYTRRYEQHNREVRAYFQHRPGDLLEMNITRKEGWEKLCPFLNLPVPRTPFPHSNKASDREDRNVLTKTWRKLIRHWGRVSAKARLGKPS